MAFNLQALLKALGRAGQAGLSNTGTPSTIPPGSDQQPDLSDNYYPNGVKRQAWDERLPDGRSMSDLANASVNGSWWRSGEDTPPPNPEMIAKSRQMSPFPATPNSQPDDLASIYQQNGGVPLTYSGPGNSTSSSVLGNRTPGYDDAEQNLISAIKAPIGKKAWWKDALVKGALAASNIYRGGWEGARPQDMTPIVGLGRLEHDRAVNRSYQQYAPLRQLENQRVGDAMKEISGENTKDDNRRADQQAIDREKYWNRKADQNDLKQATNDDLIHMRDRWMVSKDQNDKRRLDIVEKELGERQRHNQVSETQASKNEQGRNTRAKNTIAATDARTQRAADARIAYANYNDALAKGRMDLAQQYKLQLAKLKAAEEADKNKDVVGTEPPQ